MDPLHLTGALKLNNEGEGGYGEGGMGTTGGGRSTNMISDCSWACWAGAGDSASKSSLQSLLSVLRPEEVNCGEVIQLGSSSVN